MEPCMVETFCTKKSSMTLIHAEICAATQRLVGCDHRDERRWLNAHRGRWEVGLNGQPVWNLQLNLSADRRLISDGFTR